MLPAGVVCGQIYRHTSFYRNDEGVWETKYLLVLTGTPGGDIVFRLLTSRQNGRPVEPPCYHGHPYPGFHLGVLGGSLNFRSWLDLRPQEDFEGQAFEGDFNSSQIAWVLDLPLNMICDALDCAARAEDTTTGQSRMMRDQRAALNCR